MQVLVAFLRNTARDDVHAIFPHEPGVGTRIEVHENMVLDPVLLVADGDGDLGFGRAGLGPAPVCRITVRFRTVFPRFGIEEITDVIHGVEQPLFFVIPTEIPAGTIRRPHRQAGLSVRTTEDRIVRLTDFKGNVLDDRGHLGSTPFGNIVLPGFRD